jgi:hypothetical protein
MTETPREAVLSEAAGLITGDRNKTYGSPTENFDNTAAIWNALLGHKLKEPITSTEVGTLMVGLKLARTIAQPKRDNFVDMAGYAACAWECEEAAADAVQELAPRYFRDDYLSAPWVWIYRMASDGLTFVSRDDDRRRSSFVDPAQHGNLTEISADEVPEWAR